MVAVQEIFRSAGFGGLKALSAALGGGFMATFTKYFSQAHVLAFGVLVVVVIMTLPNGVVGDWARIKRLFRRD